MSSQNPEIRSLSPKSDCISKRPVSSNIDSLSYNPNSPSDPVSPLQHSMPPGISAFPNQSPSQRLPQPEAGALSADKSSTNTPKPSHDTIHLPTNPTTAPPAFLNRLISPSKRPFDNHSPLSQHPTCPGTKRTSTHRPSSDATLPLEYESLSSYTNPPTGPDTLSHSFSAQHSTSNHSPTSPVLSQNHIFSNSHVKERHPQLSIPQYSSNYQGQYLLTPTPKYPADEHLRCSQVTSSSNTNIQAITQASSSQHSSPSNPTQPISTQPTSTSTRPNSNQSPIQQNSLPEYRSHTAASSPPHPNPNPNPNPNPEPNPSPATKPKPKPNSNPRNHNHANMRAFLLAILSFINLTRCIRSSSSSFPSSESHARSRAQIQTQPETHTNPAPIEETPSHRKIETGGKSTGAAPTPTQPQP